MQLEPTILWTIGHVSCLLQQHDDPQTFYEVWILDGGVSITRKIFPRGEDATVFALDAKRIAETTL